MFISNNLIVASLFVIASSFVNAAPTNASSPLTTINSQNDFCLFLPPQPGLVVAVNEDNGIPFCTKQNTVPNAKAFPSGFITTAHYLKSSSYVQITGFFDRTKYKLGANDGGGQYDNHAHGKPVGAQCKGYKYFVSLIEPDIERFCIRCCQDKTDCNTGRSGYGCLRVVAGDYTRDNNFGTVTTKKNATAHANTHLNSVLTDLDVLEPVTEDPSASDASTDDASTEDASTDDASTDDASTEDASTEDASTDDASTEDASTTDDSSADADADASDASTTDATTTDTTTNANQEIASEIEILKTELTANQNAVDQVQTKWNTFADKLSTDYPQVTEQIKQLSTFTTSLTTADQWTAFFNLVSNNIIQIQGNNTETADTTDAANTTEDSFTPTTSVSIEQTSTLTHTDSPEDLAWLFEHRNSHDNQATW